MKILMISDTHTMHLDFPASTFTDIDMIIHCGDMSNTFSPVLNVNEVVSFLNWYDDIPVKYKLLVAGNHDGSIYHKLVRPNEYHKTIIYLEHEEVVIEGIKFFGSPYTPVYGNWAFMKKKGRLSPLWEQIPSDTDFLITHGPPKGILDLSFSPDKNLEYCGDQELMNRIMQLNIKHHCFGHIHKSKGCLNAGSRTLMGLNTQFHNASCVIDGKFNQGLSSFGITIDL